MKKINFPFCILCLAVFWLIFLFLFNPHYIYTYSLIEEWFMSHGLIYYKDFSSFHFPLSRLFMLSTHLLTNWDLELDPFIALVFGIGNLYLLYLFGKKFLSPIGNSLTLIFFATQFWYLATGILYFHEIFISFLLTIVIFLSFNFIQNKKTSFRYLFILGLAIALTEMSGQVCTPTLLVIGVYVIYRLVKTTKFVILPKYIFYFMSGIFLPFIILSAYFIWNNAFEEYFFSNIIYYFRYAGYDKNLAALPYNQLLLYYFPFFMMAALVIIKAIKRQSINFQNYFMLLLSASSIPFIVFSLYHPHHLNYALPILSVTFGLSFDLIKKSGILEKLVFAASAVFILLLTMTIIFPWQFSRLIYPPNIRIANDLYPQDNNSLAQTVNWLKNNSQQQDKIIVVGTPIIYVKSNRFSSIQRSFGLPHVWEPMSETIEQIYASPPKYWVIDRGYMKRLIKDYKRFEMVDFVEQDLKNCYGLEIQFEDWQIWKKGC